jgi:cob(I)alamin adenosyltransferase
MGWLRDQEINISRGGLLKEIQDTLFAIGARLAASPGKNSLNLPQLFESDIQLLEDAIDNMEKNLDPLKNFILPGGHPSVSFCHIARCVCRRAEREVIRLHKHEPVESLVIKYLNRLSDYLFVLSRTMAKEMKAPEIVWKVRP